MRGDDDDDDVPPDCEGLAARTSRASSAASGAGVGIIDLKRAVEAAGLDAELLSGVLCVAK